MIAAHGAAGAASPCDDAARRITPRAPRGLTGTQFAHEVAGLTGPARDAAVLAELLAGNLPGFLRHAAPVELRVPAGRAAPVRVVVCVLPDYLAVGTDDDLLRVPMGLEAALAVGHAFGFTLPTRRIVDAIHAQARVRLAPHPLPPGDAMRTTAYLVRHEAAVQAARAAAGGGAAALTAGHKKDLVLTPRLWAQPGRVAIYGWHRALHAPIQPLSTMHGARYADYSHGVRLVGVTVFVDGARRSIFDVLRDPVLSAALSDEGPIAHADEAPPPGDGAGDGAGDAQRGSVLQQRKPR